MLLQCGKAFHEAVECSLDYLEVCRESEWGNTTGALAATRMVCLFVTEERHGPLWERSRDLIPFLVRVGSDAPQPFLLPLIHALEEDDHGCPPEGLQAAARIEAQLPAH